MNSILKKLGLTDQNPVLIINAPEEYKEIMKDIEAEIDNIINDKYSFIQVFAKNMNEAENNAEEIINSLDFHR